MAFGPRRDDATDEIEAHRLVFRAALIDGTKGFDSGKKRRLLRAPGNLRLLNLDRAEAQGIARLHAAKARKVGGDDGRHPGITTRGLMVGQEHDRQARARHLHGTRRHPVRQDVMTALMGELRPFEPGAHPVGLRRDHIAALEQGAYTGPGYRPR